MLALRLMLLFYPTWLVWLVLGSYLQRESGNHCLSWTAAPAAPAAPADWHKSQKSDIQVFQRVLPDGVKASASLLHYNCTTAPSCERRLGVTNEFGQCFYFKFPKESFIQAIFCITMCPANIFFVRTLFLNVLWTFKRIYTLYNCPNIMEISLLNDLSNR